MTTPIVLLISVSIGMTGGLAAGLLHIVTGLPIDSGTFAVGVFAGFFVASRLFMSRYVSLEK